MVSCVTKEPKLRPMMTCQLGFHRSSKCLLIFSAAASPAQNEAVIGHTDVESCEGPEGKLIETALVHFFLFHSSKA